MRHLDTDTDWQGISQQRNQIKCVNLLSNENTHLESCHEPIILTHAEESAQVILRTCT